MPSLGQLAQRTFIRGLIASTDRYTQPKNSYPANTNLINTHRGSLVTIDGTDNLWIPSVDVIRFHGLGALIDTHQESFAAITEVVGLGMDATVNQHTGAPTIVSLTGAAQALVAITSATRHSSSIVVTTTGAHPYTLGQIVTITGSSDGTFDGSFMILSVPSSTSFTVHQDGNPANGNSTGGNVSAGALNPATTYFYKVTCVDYSGQIFEDSTFWVNSYGQSLPTAESSGAPGGANNTFSIVITPPSSAAGVLVYRGTVSGTNRLVSGYIPNTNPGGNLTFVDMGSSFNAISGTNVNPPGADTTATVTFIVFPNAYVNYSSTTHKVTSFPRMIRNSNNDLPSFRDDMWTPFGGILGMTSPIPQLIQFTDKLVLGLGNGYPPYLFTGGNAVPTKITSSSGKAPPGAAAIISHAGSLWVGNTSPFNTLDNLDGPSAIAMSDSNNAGAWNNTNKAFIGKDDGTQITGFATFTIAETGIIPTGSLVVFKEFSTYQIIGVFGSSNFSIQQAQTDLGCIAPRTIQFVPGFGIVRLTHLGWAVFDGVRDRLISEEVRPYIFFDPAGNSDYTNALTWALAYDSRATQTIKPPLYVNFYDASDGAPGGQHMLMFDAVLNNWNHGVWDLGKVSRSPVLSCFQLRSQATQPITLVATYNGNVSKWQDGQENWDTIAGSGGTQINWNLRTPAVFSGNASDRVFLRRLLVRGTRTSSTALTAPTAALRYNGATLYSGVPFILSQLRTDARYSGVISGFPALVTVIGEFPQFELDLGINRVVTIADCLISGVGRVELNSFDWSLSKKSSGLPARVGR